MLTSPVIASAATQSTLAHRMEARSIGRASRGDIASRLARMRATELTEQGWNSHNGPDRRPYQPPLRRARGARRRVVHGRARARWSRSSGPPAAARARCCRSSAGCCSRAREGPSCAARRRPDSLNPLTFVFQDFALLPWCTVEANVEFPLAAYRARRRRAPRRRRRRAAPHGPVGFPRRLSKAIVRRHAPARRHCARARGAAGDPADGRAAVGAGFADPRIADGGFYPLARRRRDGRGLCHA